MSSRNQPLAPAEQLDSAHIDWLNATVTKLDLVAKELTLVDGSRLGFDKLLLATDVAARRFPERVFSDASILCLRGRADADRLSRHAREAEKVLIIGGSFIGLELAASLCRPGLGVTPFSKRRSAFSHA
ncbi:MAG: FAD-dependent oxidoreductase [Geminicoccaceae bacterium]